VPQTGDCEVHRTDYANRAAYSVSYSCQIADAGPLERNNATIVRDVSARLRPCLPGWSEVNIFSEHRSATAALHNIYVIEYTKGGRKVSIVRLRSRDDTSFSTTFNVTDSVHR
jgi:hypothetical protein